MSYSDEKCPCGGKKQRDTMICADCETAFAERHEMTRYKDETVAIDLRRHAAIILLSLARGRKRKRS